MHEKADLRPGRASMKTRRASMRPGSADLRSPDLRLDFLPEMPDFEA